MTYDYKWNETWVWDYKWNETWFMIISRMKRDGIISGMKDERGYKWNEIWDMIICGMKQEMEL